MPDCYTNTEVFFFLAPFTNLQSYNLPFMYQTAVLLWMHDPATRDAVVLRQSLSGDFINLEAATEVICSRTSTQIQTIKQIYHSMFGTYVEHDVAIHASGDHEKVNCLFCPSLYVEVHFIAV